MDQETKVQVVGIQGGLLVWFHPNQNGRIQRWIKHNRGLVTTKSQQQSSRLASMVIPPYTQGNTKDRRLQDMLIKKGVLSLCRPSYEAQ